MRQDVERGVIQAVVVSKIARLARSAIHLLEFAEFFDKHGVHLVSLAESIDTTTPHGRAQYGMIATFAQWEREEIASRVAASIPVRARLGKSLGGVCPYGFQWKDKKLIPHPDEAPVRKLMFELFFEYQRLGTVARVLHERGYRTRKGHQWSDCAIARLLEDPLAKGRRRSNFTKAGAPGKPWALKPESDWVWHDVEPIVSEELWNQVNLIRAQHRASRKKPGRRAKHLFTGIAFCHCGQKLYVPSSSPHKYVCLACRNKIPMKDLEAVFRDQLRGFFLSADDLARSLGEVDENIKAKETLLASQEAETKLLTAEMDKVMELYLSASISKEGFKERYSPLELQRNQLRDELPRLQGELDFLKINLATSDDFIRQARDLYGHWDDLIHDEKRKIIEAVAERITLGKGEVDIDLCFRPSASQTAVEAQRHRVDAREAVPVDEADAGQDRDARAACAFGRGTVGDEHDRVRIGIGERDRQRVVDVGAPVRRGLVHEAQRRLFRRGRRGEQRRLVRVRLGPERDEVDARIRVELAEDDLERLLQLVAFGGLHAEAERVAHRVRVVEHERDVFGLERQVEQVAVRRSGVGRTALRPLRRRLERGARLAVPRLPPVGLRSEVDARQREERLGHLDADPDARLAGDRADERPRRRARGRRVAAEGAERARRRDADRPRAVEERPRQMIGRGRTRVLAEELARGDPRLGSAVPEDDRRRGADGVVAEQDAERLDRRGAEEVVARREELRELRRGLAVAEVRKRQRRDARHVGLMVRQSRAQLADGSLPADGECVDREDANLRLLAPEADPDDRRDLVGGVTRLREDARRAFAHLAVLVARRLEERFEDRGAALAGELGHRLQPKLRRVLLVVLVEDVDRGRLGRR
jgi:site-specific DNA recombinase